MLAPTFPDRQRHQPRLDITALREILRARAPSVRAAVIFAVDMRASDVEALRKDLVYSLPRVEIVQIPSAKFEPRIAELAEYYGLVATPRPNDLADALSMLNKRFPNIEVLPRAVASAEVAAAFVAPREALHSMHFLPRIYVDWADARRRDPGRSNHADLRDLRYPARDAFREVLQDARFDVSDSSTALMWKCNDDLKRDFGWHLKWSLGGRRGADNHCRIHYHVVRGDGITDSTVIIGHCGEHR